MDNKDFSDLKKRITELEMRVLKLEQAQSSRTGTLENYNSNSEKKLSIREFINSINPKNNVERVLSIAYYKETFDSVSPFTAKDIADGFKDAKEPVPNNINLPIFYNVQKGYLMENNSPESKLKSWELTNTGIKVMKERTNEN